MNSEARQTGPSALIVVLLIAVIGWILVHPYMGLYHDANLYALQGLARLHPQSLAQDVFLRFGSQDRFTLFSPLFALCIDLFGIDRGAMVLTLVSQGALIASAGLLARRLIPPGAVAFGLAALLTVPLFYGPDRIFKVLEEFCTPRMAAEALVLAALALTERRALCALLMIGALLLHPVMAAPGLILVVSLLREEMRARLMRPPPSIVIAVVALSLFIALHGWRRFDANWLAVVKARNPYLFLSFWNSDDWGRAAVVVSTLLLSGAAFDGFARRFARLVLITTLCGWVITVLGNDLLHSVLVTQAQPWRWQWIGTLTAVLLLPELARRLWMQDLAGRIAGLSILAAWLFASDAPALIASGAAAASLLLPRTARPKQRILFWGACLLAALALSWRIATNLQFSESHYLDTSWPTWLRQTMSFVTDGSLALALLACLRITPYRIVRAAVAPLAIAAGIAAWMIGPYAWRNLVRREYPPSMIEAFAPWRALVPSNAEVLWPESTTSPWVLLNRANYLSGLQTSGALYSQAAAFEMQRRAETLGGVAPQAFLDWEHVGAALSLSTGQLEQICAVGRAEYLVTGARLNREPLAVLTTGRHPLNLYRCYARAAAAAT